MYEDAYLDEAQETPDVDLQANFDALVDNHVCDWECETYEDCSAYEI